MIGDKTVLAIIPAREGSKRLPGKNKRKLANKPLVLWSLDAATGSKYVDKVFISTDDAEIKHVCEKAGLEVPALRSKELSQDNTTTVDVVKDVLAQLDGQGKKYDYLLLLQPTSPLRNSSHVDLALEQLVSKGADAIISVCECEHSPLWANTLPADMDMKSFLPSDVTSKRSQDLSPYYRLNGAIYIVDTARFLSESAFILKDNVYAFEMDSLSSVDIDNEVDFLFAETIVEKYTT